MNIAIILAAGSGTRMQSSTPKQFLLINDKPLFIYSVEAFNKHEMIDEIIISVPSDSVQLVKNYILKYKINKVKAVVPGGSSRQDSTVKALNYLVDNGVNDQDIVLIHDAARALVSEQIITSNIKACEEYDAVETAIKATDTLVESSSSSVEKSLNRDIVYQVQTPQTFRFKIIYEAHQNNIGSIFTDDASLVIKNGHDVHIVDGDKFNFKITTSEDFQILEALKKNER